MDEGHGQIEPAFHPTRVAPTRPSIALPMSTRRSTSVTTAAPDLVLAEPEQPPLEVQQFTPGLEVIEGCVLEGDADADRTARGRRTTSWPATEAALGRTQERAQHAHHRRLPAPFGPGTVDLARSDGEVEAVHGHVGPEGPDQALRLYAPGDLSMSPVDVASCRFTY